MGKVFRFTVTRDWQKAPYWGYKVAIKLRFTIRAVANIIIGSLILGYVSMDAGCLLLVRA
jgi:hypothetical protein